MKHMEKKTSKRKIHPIAIIRAVIQLAAFILVPGLFITVFGSIKDIFTSLIGGSFVWSEQLGNLLLVGGVLLITLFWGRVFCGFLCSFGAMQDLLWLGGKHLPFRLNIPPKADRVLKYLKYAVLAFIVFGVWMFGIFGDTVWSPWTVFGASATPWLGLPPQSIILSVGGLLLVLIMIGSLLIERFFCKYLCPLGAIYSIPARFRVFKIKRDASTCNGKCRVCTRKCSMSVPLYKYDKVIQSGECINCMKCTTACPRGNIKAEPIPAVTGTVAAMMVAGVTFAGVIPTGIADRGKTTENSVAVSNTAGKFKNGTYKGSAEGFRGQTDVTVLVDNGNITSITVDSTGDNPEFFSKAKQAVIPAIISRQSVDVDTVSGATFSSQAIINAVANALGDQLVVPTTQPQTMQPSPTVPTTTQAPTEAPTEEETEAETEAPTEAETEEETQEAPQNNNGFTDGVYSGSGTGLRGTTTVEVTVQNGSITDITVTSYQDDEKFFNRAQSSVISAILSAQSTDVDTVSGATYSSNSIIEAVANALGL